MQEESRRKKQMLYRAMRFVRRVLSAVLRVLASTMACDALFLLGVITAPAKSPAS